jgi:hypothetical protein
VGRVEDAARLLAWVQDQRDPDGSYTTGRVYPERSTFPQEERTTYTAAAIVLAFDAMAGESSTSGLFLGKGLPAGLDLDEIDDEIGGSPGSRDSRPSAAEPQEVTETTATRS